MKNVPQEHFDAVVVLANLMDAQGNLNEESRERVRTAVQALKARATSMLVTCGWAYRGDSDLCIADAMADYAVEEFGVDKDRVLRDYDSRDTVGDAVFTKRNFAARLGWSNILVVTTNYHTSRSAEIFSFVYGPEYHLEVRGSPSITAPEVALSEAKSLEAFRSTFLGVNAGDDAAIFERIRTAHPFYNGTIYPKI